MSMWNELGIEPTRERRAIKLAYAARLKQTNPEDDPAAFQLLRQAYERALALADSGVKPLPAMAAGDDGAGFPDLDTLARRPPAAPAPSAPVPPVTPSQGPRRREGRAALPALALDAALAVPQRLNVQLESDAAIAQQAGQLKPPGPRPVTPYFKRPAPAIDDAALAAEVRQLCAQLLATDPAARTASFAQLVRARAWHTRAFTLRLEAALVSTIGDAWDTHWHLVAPIAAHYRWQSGGRDTKVLMRRALARAWSAPILALPAAHPARTALAMLAGELDEATVHIDAANASRAGAVRALLEQLKSAPEDALPYLVNANTLAWWTRHLAQPAKLRKAEERAEQLIARAASEAQRERVPLLLRPVAGTRDGWPRLLVGAVLMLVVGILLKLFVL
jgi:hypothetical protein